MKQYEAIYHTADMGIRAWGRTKKDLFANAADGMLNLIVDKKTVAVKKKINITLKAPDIKELFVSWLRELLYQYSGKGMVFKKITISKLTGTQITGIASGEKINSRHILKNDLKAVTYHGLDIKKTKTGFKTQVIFDV